MLKGIVDMLWPGVCRVCGCGLPDGVEHVCAGCVENLPRTLYHLREHSPMEERFAGQTPFVRATSWILYSRGGAIAQLIHDFKYRGLGSLAERLGEDMGKELKGGGFFDGVDWIEPVPMHWLKRAKRGYNQADRLGRGVSRATGIPLGRHLRARRGHVTQTALDLAGRLGNMEGIFEVRHPEELRGKGVLLLDDVCTTGATLLAMAQSLSAAVPDCRVYILTLASTT